MQRRRANEEEPEARAEPMERQRAFHGSRPAPIEVEKQGASGHLFPHLRATSSIRWARAPQGHFIAHLIEWAVSTKCAIKQISDLAITEEASTIETELLT